MDDSYNSEFQGESEFQAEAGFDPEANFLVEDELQAESSRSRGRGFNLLNVLTILFLFGACAVVAFLVLIFVTPDNFFADLLGFQGEPTPTLLAAAVAPPTFTPSPIPTETSDIGQLPPTHTPIPEQNTATPVPINTLRPTLTPSITPTFPPPTPTKTPTPTPTDTPTPGPSPTATSTRSPFPFTKDVVSPQYLQNYANSAGCNWMGIAGEVFDLQGNPVPFGQYRVHVWESGVDKRVTVGDAPAYGPSGYEQFLFDAPRVQDQNVQLETSNGTAVSQVYRVQTRASCNQNLLYIVFVQNH
jgi:hypothetical protein